MVGTWVFSNVRRVCVCADAATFATLFLLVMHITLHRLFRSNAHPSSVKEGCVKKKYSRHLKCLILHRPETF